MSAAAPLTFDEASHTYRVGGEVWPGVTSVLEPLQFLDGIPWAVLEAARKFGTHVHQAIHLWNEQRLDEEALDPHLRPYVAGWAKFLKDSGAIVLASEQRVVNRRLRYCGTLDSIVLWKKRNVLVDVKSGVVPKTVGMQTAAYRAAYSGPLTLSPNRYCVQLNNEGTYRLHKLTDPTDFNYFVSALNLAHWRARNVRSY